MEKVFNKYAKYYDIIYLNKDYRAECDFIEKIFSDYANFSICKILDVGCGTCGHLIELTQRGYAVTGIDASEQMINIAKNKIEKLHLNARVHVMDVRELSINQKFDAAICMFAVMNYLTKNEDLIKAFNNLRKYLKPKALLIFDFWYGPAVLTIKPSVRVKTMEKDGLKILRTVVPELDLLKHLLTSNYHLIVYKENKMIDEIKEKHILRYIFPQELKHYLEESKFRLLKICEFPELNNIPSEKTWNVAAIAKAI